MFVPRFLRVDNLFPTPLTREAIRPVVAEAMERLHENTFPEYGGALISPAEATEYALRELHLVLINGDYLLGYSKGGEWFTRQTSLIEEVLIRVGEGGTSLEHVFEAYRLMARLHGAREAFVCPGSESLKRLYAKHGAEETVTTMRIP